MRKSMLIGAACSLAFAVLAAAHAPAAIRAQAPIAVVSDQTQNEFPRGVSFAVTFNAPASTKDVRLQYHLAPDGTGATAVASCTGASTTTCTYSLVSGNGISIIPGAEITYHWEIEDTAGNKLSTGDTNRNAAVNYLLHNLGEEFKQDQTKNGTPRGVPLNVDAVQVLREQIGKHPRVCFTHMGEPIRWQLSNTGWQRALERAGIKDFRFHDLRHTWASWHRQAGTSCDELKDLGGWKSRTMVDRYAKFATENLLSAASRIEAGKGGNVTELSRFRHVQ